LENQGEIMSKMPEEKIQEWKDNLSNQLASGFSIAQWCRQSNIPPHKFYYWKKRLLPSKELTRASFSELEDAKGSGIFFECSGMRLHIEHVPDPLILKQCLKILKETC
jgi:hypothetical protein